MGSLSWTWLSNWTTNTISWGRKESDTTEQLNWTELNWTERYLDLYKIHEICYDSYFRTTSFCNVSLEILFSKPTYLFFSWGSLSWCHRPSRFPRASFLERAREEMMVFIQKSLGEMVLIGSESESHTVMSDSFYNPMGYSVHEILQARILEWIAIPFCRGSSQPKDWTQVSHITGRFFTVWATREAL